VIEKLWEKNYSSWLYCIYSQHLNLIRIGEKSRKCLYKFRAMWTKFIFELKTNHYQLFKMQYLYQCKCLIFLYIKVIKSRNSENADRHPDRFISNFETNAKYIFECRIRWSERARRKRNLLMQLHWAETQIISSWIRGIYFVEILAKFMLSPFHPRLLVYVLPFKRIVSDDEFYYNIRRHVVCFSEMRLNLLFAAFDEKKGAR